MKPFDIVLFDVKEFSKFQANIQIEIKESIQKNIAKYFEDESLHYESISTGDGYYICLESNDRNDIYLYELIATLISELDDVEIRFALHTGYLAEFTEINKSPSLIGRALIDLNRYLAGVKPGNIILASRKFYEKFINRTQITSKKLSDDSEIITFKKLTIQDKHSIIHELFNISYLKDSIEYGFEFTEEELGIGKSDILEFDDFKKIIEYSFGRKKATLMAKGEQSKPSIHYCYFMLNISQYTKEYFLFIKNNSVKKQTIDHFVNNNKIYEPLTICANNKYLDEKQDDFWKNDLLKKFNTRAPAIKKVAFHYIDDFLWANCIPETLKTPLLFDEESNFINPEYVASDIDNSKEILVENYLFKFITNDSTPIALIKGSGGMGKTTLLKRMSDSLSKNINYQKLVFYIDGQNIAKYLYRNEELHIERIETMAGLLRFYFSTLTSSGSSVNSEAPILLNDELVNIIISSGNIVIMVDGLDEISAFLKENFSLNTFISDIVNINRILNHSKILISTRDYYWDNEMSNIEAGLIENFKLITLQGFNQAMAEEYFVKKFGADSENKIEALKILKSLTRNKSVDVYYWPFLVYLVSDIVLKEKGKKTNFTYEASDGKSKYLDPRIEFDFIIINFCLREIKRQNLDLDVDDFIELFKEIIIEHQGEMNINDFKEYVNTLMPSISQADNGFEGFKTLLINPLLKEKYSKALISIDFIQYNLTTAFLAYFIEEDVHSINIYKHFSRFYDGKEDMLKDLINRLRKNNVDLQRFQMYIRKLVLNLKKEDVIVTEKQVLQRTVSTLLYVAFRLFESRSSIDAKERTELLKELFQNDLDNVHIFGDFYSLDFSSLVIRNSTLKNYSNLFKSFKDDKTLFIDSKIEIIYSAKDYMGSNALWTESNFDKSCIINSDFKVILKSTKAHKISDFHSIKKDLSSLLKRFQRSGRFIFQAEDHLDFSTSSKLNSAQLINELVHYKIITKENKRLSYNWSVNESEKDSVNQLLHNNHVDSNFEKIIDNIYSKYYK